MQHTLIYYKKACICVHLCSFVFMFHIMRVRKKLVVVAFYSFFVEEGVTGSPFVSYKGSKCMIL